MRKGCFGLVSLVLLLLVGCRSHPEIRRLIFNLQHPQRFITKGKNPLPFIIVFTGMTPEGWRCILWKGHAALPFPHIRR